MFCCKMCIRDSSSSSTTAGGGETPAAGTAESAADSGETPTLTFFDKNSGSKQFDDPVALELMKRTGINIEVVNPTEDPAEKPVSYTHLHPN